MVSILRGVPDTSCQVCGPSRTAFSSESDHTHVGGGTDGGRARGATNRALDERLASMNPASPRPRSGWIRAVRTAFGITRSSWRRSVRASRGGLLGCRRSGCELPAEPAERPEEDEHDWERRSRTVSRGTHGTYGCAGIDTRGRARLTAGPWGRTSAGPLCPCHGQAPSVRARGLSPTRSRDTGPVPPGPHATEDRDNRQAAVCVPPPPPRARCRSDGSRAGWPWSGWWAPLPRYRPEATPPLEWDSWGVGGPDPPSR